MMNIREHINEDNLHHAYLIEGTQDEIVPAIFKFAAELDIQTANNPDFIHIHTDSFKIEDARNLKSYATEKSFSSGKKIFIISANNFLLEAQNSLLKMFEEPVLNTHFFLVVPDTNSLLRTLVSRFYLISTRQDLAEEVKQAEKFVKMSLRNRIDFIKELLAEGEGEKEDEEGNEILILNSTRSKALKFLNALEIVIHNRLLKNSEWCGSHSVLREGSSQKNFSVTCMEHFFKVREFLRMPGSSPKTLMESVALIIPDFSN